MISFPTSADVLQVMRKAIWFSFNCTEYFILYNGSKGVQTRKAETTISLSCQTWTPQKATTADFLPKTWLHTPKVTAGKEQWYLQTLPTYAAWLAVHPLRCNRRIWGTFSRATTWPKFRLKLPKFIIPVRGADEGDARDSFLKQCTAMSNLSQSWYLSPINFLRTSSFLFFINLIRSKQTKTQTNGNFSVVLTTKLRSWKLTVNQQICKELTALTGPETSNYKLTQRKRHVNATA